MYRRGEGVEPNATEAVVWLRRAAEQGDASAQHLMGYCFYNGEGVRQDQEEAVGWFRRSAEQGYGPGQCALGISLWNGDGAAQNMKEGYFWFFLSLKDQSMTGDDRSICERYLGLAKKELGKKQAEEQRRRAEAWRPSKNNQQQ